MSTPPRPTPTIGALLDRIRSDALVTRRDYLRILVTVSGGLLAGTVAVALGVFKRPTSAVGAVPALKVADALPPGASVRFAYPGPDDEAIAIRMGNGMLVGYSSECTHLSCAVLWEPGEEHLECPCHHGFFDAATGAVVAGPPPRPLPKVLLEERRDGIYAVGVTV